MKNEFYYYLRNGGHHPVVTVCLIKDDGGNIGRGVTIWKDTEDKLSKKEGRRWARKYAKKALGTRQTDLPISKDEVQDIIKNVYEYKHIDPVSVTENKHIIVHKSVFNPKLTAYEDKLLKKVCDEKK
uniref:Uncharacterized protein n=1 Tax=viral metagenome TaxID=1070528 RepID=A0A6M3JTG8_9ZZZZ